MDFLQRHLFFLMVLLVSAEEESYLGQRATVFDPFELMDGEQKEVTYDGPVIQGVSAVLRPGPPVFGPRSTGPRQIPFPLALPKASNIQAICQYRSERPRYPKETLPSTGFGYLVRQANAINMLEFWFSRCCSNSSENEELTLCCAEQAWKKSLSAFCSMEFSVKTSHYPCCKKKGSEIWACFEKNAPDQSYQPSDPGSWADIPPVEEEFTFEPETCQINGSYVEAMKGKVSIVLNNLFPLGQPNSRNIGSICSNQKQRRKLYARCLPRKDFSRMPRQAKAAHDLEKNFKQCCKRKDKQACAEKKWKRMVDELCVAKDTDDLVQFDCCEKEKGAKQYDCFAAAAPNPDYVFPDTLSVEQPRPTLDMFCDIHKEYNKMQREEEVINSEVVDKLAGRCCHLVDEKRLCLRTELENIAVEMCNHGMWKYFSCCKHSPKSRTRCFSIHVLRRTIKMSEWNSRQNKCPVFA